MNDNPVEPAAEIHSPFSFSPEQAESLEVLPVEPLSWSKGDQPRQQPVAAAEAATAENPPAADASLPGASALSPARQAEKERYHPLVEQVSEEFGLDADLLHAMIRVESNYQPDAVSHKGARGLMQVMPDTGKRFGYSNLLDPQHNLRAGASYMQWLINHFDNDLTLALAGYNAGEGAVKRYGRQIPPYAETRDYVKKVMNHYQQPQSTPLAANNHYAVKAAAVTAEKDRAENEEETTVKGHILATKLLGLLISSPTPSANSYQSPQDIYREL